MKIAATKYLAPEIPPPPANRGINEAGINE